MFFDGKKINVDELIEKEKENEENSIDLKFKEKIKSINLNESLIKNMAKYLGLFSDD